MGQLWLHKNKDKEISKFTNIKWVEIGVRFGYNAENVLNNYNIDKIYLIDPYCELPYLTHLFSKDKVKDYKVQARNRLNKYKNKCIWLEDFSQNVCDKIEGGSIDILYIDGDHSSKAVLQDLELYYDKVKEGGLIIGDDYNEEGVKEAIEEFSKIRNIKYNTSHNNNDDTHKFWFNK